MQCLWKLCLFTLALATLPTQSLGQTAPQNLVSGTGVLNSKATWQGYSAINVIAGSSLFPISSKTTVLYIAFTGGTSVDIGKMVLYKTTARNSLTIASVTPVKFSGATSGTINLSNSAVCPVQPLSLDHPCFIRFDPLKLKLSPLVDYYFVAYFLNDTNNSGVNSATSQFSTSTITGGFELKDDTKLKKGNLLPSGFNTGRSYFLVGVMDN